MDKQRLPQIFLQLQSEGLIQESDLMKTGDGFYLLYKSLADLLAEKNIFDVVDSEGVRLACSRFFDDWFLYAVPGTRDYICSLLKLREQEYDAADGGPADGDTPGVTISFISFDCTVLFACLADPGEENRKKLNREINRVVAYGGQRHHPDLKKYFIDPKSEGAYLVADVYTRHIAAMAENGCLPVPERYKQILQQSISYKDIAKFARIPRFIESLNRKAGYGVCDSENIYIKDRNHPDPVECAAILATHTGNTSIFSFAAEVEYHAKFLTPLAKARIPFFGKSIYASAVRADMTIDDPEYEGPAPFYRRNSRIVKRQYICHKDNYKFWKS